MPDSNVARLATGVLLAAVLALLALASPTPAWADAAALQYEAIANPQAVGSR